MSETAKNLSFYIHYPFCARKCPYCDFVSYDDSKVDRNAYVAALIGELEAFRETVYAEFQTATIYFGGGTPSLMDARQISALIESVNRKFPVAPDAEITLEVNPATASATDMILWRSFGINRLSVGFQSSDGASLEKLGRIHTVEDAFGCYESARRAGFQSVGVDLIFGIPGQTMDEWKADLNNVVRLDPDHVSAYILKPPDGWNTPPDDELADMYVFTVETLESAGLRHYEVSNFARANNESRHNLNYWKSGDYLGLGVAAHSHFGLVGLSRNINPRRPLGADAPQDAMAVRWWNIITPERYIESVGKKEDVIDGFEYIDEARSFRENLLLALRIRDGIGLEFFDDAQSQRLSAPIHELVSGGFALKGDGRLRLTVKGMLLADEIAALLIAAIEA